MDDRDASNEAFLDRHDTPRQRARCGDECAWTYQDATAAIVAQILDDGYEGEIIIPENPDAQAYIFAHMHERVIETCGGRA